MWGNIVSITLAESQESTQGETCQYSGQKLCLDDELLSTLNTKWSFTMPFHNQTLEIALVSSSQLSRGFYSTWILCLYSTLRRSPFVFTRHVHAFLLVRKISYTSCPWCCRVSDGNAFKPWCAGCNIVSLILYYKNTTHLSSSRVTPNGVIFSAIFVEWQDFVATDYFIRSQVCSTFWNLETLLWQIVDLTLKTFYRVVPIWTFHHFFIPRHSLKRMS